MVVNLTIKNDMQDEGPHVRNGVSRGYYVALFRWRTNTMNRASYRVIRPCQDNHKKGYDNSGSRTNTSSRNLLHSRLWNLGWEEQASGIMRNWKN